MALAAVFRLALKHNVDINKTNAFDSRRRYRSHVGNLLRVLVVEQMNLVRSREHKNVELLE